VKNKGLSGGFSVRWHIVLSYLLIIWVALGIVFFFIARRLETTAIETRRSYLYAQAHLLASAIRARGGPEYARLTAIGGIPFQGRVLVLDGQGRVLEDSAMDPDFAGKVLTNIEVTQALKGFQSSNTYYMPDGTFVMYVAVPSDWYGYGGAVLISQDLSDVVEQNRNVIRTVLAGGGIASLVALALALVLAYLITKPLSELSNVSRRVALGRFDIRVNPKGPAEIRSLGKSFNYMASEIEKTWASHESFLLAAAHELRSPLSTLNVLVESMQIRKPTHEELPELLNDLEGEIQRLTGISEEILDLLRLKSGDYPVEQVKLKELMHSIITDGIHVSSKKGILFQTDVKDITLKMNPVLFRLIAGNLLDNAIKFTPAGGYVSVEVYDKATDLVFRVEDSGIGIEKEELANIFQRFYKVDKARQRNIEGSGLGLSIVHEACQRSGAAVSVESSPGKGSVFTVTWRSVVVK
jgi:two-component system OmpR family sensor kinase